MHLDAQLPPWGRNVIVIDHRDARAVATGGRARPRPSPTLPLGAWWAGRLAGVNRNAKKIISEILLVRLFWCASLCASCEAAPRAKCGSFSHRLLPRGATQSIWLSKLPNPFFCFPLPGTNPQHARTTPSHHPTHTHTQREREREREGGRERNQRQRMIQAPTAQRTSDPNIIERERKEGPKCVIDTIRRHGITMEEGEPSFLPPFLPFLPSFPHPPSHPNPPKMLSSSSVAVAGLPLPLSPSLPLSLPPRLGGGDSGVCGGPLYSRVGRPKRYRSL